MPDINILTESELRQCVVLDLETVQCVEDCFRALATEDIAMPPILSMNIADHNGEIDVKTAYVPGLDSFAVKISPGFFDNPKLGLPSVNGLMVALSAKTGLVEAVLLDNGYLTDIRTAAAGAVAAKWLARSDCRSVGIVGAGVQAGLQLRALTLVREIEAVSVWARDFEKASNFAAELESSLDIAVTPRATPREVIEGHDIVVTTTPSTVPLIEADWLLPGQHITTMGSDAEHKNELDPAAVSRADLFVCDRLGQSRVVGEVHHAIEAGVVAADEAFPELGQVIAGQVGGRSSDAEITICDLTGTGVQDTAIATFALARASAAELGTLFSS
ncbi:MAG: cyclodeaminase [Alphaproteobacteria bacterium]|nr:cyclodeaminase [Alphaproteobacteria bacterium]